MKDANYIHDLVHQKLLPLLAFLGVIVLWELGCRLFSVPDYVFPAPSQIFDAFLGVDGQRWLGHLWATLRVALSGFALSVLISIPMAILMVRSVFLKRTLLPFLIVVQSTPIVAVAPLIIVILGAGEAPRTVIACLISFFPIVVATTSGLLSTPREMLELSNSLNASPVRQIWQVRLPYAVPHIFSGLKVAITLAIIGAVIAEFVAAEQGLGYFVQFSTSYFRIPQAFAALFFLSVVSLLLFKAVQWVQQTFFAWSLPADSER
ncbi:ABC transporter permease [Halomonas sp. PAMB 3232]|uniref:ABC transporter permease n=1 Tax=Halomonas sp. PAMB 3232 TaxID=3075221 RepID=UPI00289C65EF|nr:ABC transporter permease [Halomonas sp. PAMB 3232]WNL39135.1 ABC transporter permease [Halomonas sp. PAMB 3232]